MSKTGIIGCGKMGRALLVGAIRKGAIAAEDVYAYNRSQGGIDELLKEEPVKVAESVAELAGACEVILLCTKPDDVPSALRTLGEVARPQGTLVISVAAGVTLEALEKAAGPGVRVIRSMPNTPSLVGEGASAFCLGSQATAEDAEVARRILGSVGVAVEVKEKLMDAVTGLSGSGPAYVFTFIEALTDGAVRNGLPRDKALDLAVQTVVGAATMIRETGMHPAVLRDMVTSPGGTTITGVAALEKGNFRSTCIEAVSAATKRSRSLGRPRR
ncbi:MAG: pyrroline-5-carboxylate reductase [Verrucomicrobiales bacterium]